MAKTYKGNIAKDHIWMALTIGGLGAILTIAPLIVLYLWVKSVTGAGTPLGDIALNVGFFILLFLIGSGACFYLVWRGINERVVVEGGAITYSAAFSTRKVPALNIEKIMIFDSERPVVIYDASEDMKRLKLPSWKSHDYINSLVNDLKPMNPNIDVVDLRKGTDVPVKHEEAV